MCVCVFKLTGSEDDGASLRSFFADGLVLRVQMVSLCEGSPGLVVSDDLAGLLLLRLVARDGLACAGATV